MSFQPDDRVKYDSLIAEQVHVSAQAILADYPALGKNLKIREEIRQHAVEETAMTLVSWCLAGRIPSRTESVTIEWPDGAWQTFKHLHLPEWFVRRFPVRMKSKTVETATHHYFVCPHIVADPQTRHLQFMATGQDIARYCR